MTNETIRPTTKEDATAILALYPRAFPEEDLVPVVSDLLVEPDVVSLAAFVDDRLVGHIGFTACGVHGWSGKISMLAPLAVEPAHQRRGIGSALIREGFKRLEETGVACVVVLGDPTYYGRFGFRAESGIAPPYPLPDAWRNAWQSVWLQNPDSKIDGALSVPGFWQHEELWSE